MIKSLTVINPSGDKLILELGNPDPSGLVVTNITGIGPGSASINMSEIATLDGESVNSVRKSFRNIVISLTFLDHKTIEESRLLTYRFFPVKKNITMIIETDNRKSQISGWVESNDPQIFSKMEGTDISIICPDPYFRSAGDNAVTITTFYGISPLFEFPFSDEVMSSPSLIMGNITQKTEAVIPYSGDADTGLTIIISALGEVSNITIYNLDTRESIRIEDEKLIAITGAKIQKGDEVTITTNVGNKHVTLLRNGKHINILNCLGPNPSWFKITTGDNRFAYTVDAGLLNMQFRIENDVLYMGV